MSLMNDYSERNRLHDRLRRIGIVLLALLPVVGVAAVWWFVSHADQEMREDILQRAQLVAKAIDVSHVRALSRTEADLTFWKAGRGTAGRLPPTGFPRDNKFG